MLSVITKGVKEAQKELERDAKQTKFAAAVALTRTAKKAKDVLQKEIGSSFDRPKPFTTKSIKFEKATKTKLQATVSIKPITAQYLAHHVEKRDRLSKGFESALRTKGLLPSGMYAVPGPGIKLNQYGNAGRAVLRKIITEVSTRGGKYFVATIRGITAIWMRHGRGGRAIKPMLIFIPKPSYSPRFDFYGTAEKVFKNHFEKEFDKALEQALRTAR